jgi:hypothetical protein
MRILAASIIQTLWRWAKFFAGFCSGSALSPASDGASPRCVDVEPNANSVKNMSLCDLLQRRCASRVLEAQEIQKQKYHFQEYF